MWLFYAILGASGKGLTNLFRKQISGVIDADVYLWLTLCLSVPLSGALVLIADVPVVELVKDRPLQLALNSAFWITALVLNMMALKREELSYISPLSAFTPLFTIGLAWLFLNEALPPAGLIGIIIIFVGTYVVNLKSDQVKWYEPLEHLLKNSGARYAMGVAVCFAVVSIITKNATNDGFSPIAWLFAINTLSWLMMSYVPLRKPKQIKSALRKHKLLLFNVTIVTIFGGLFGIYAIAGTYTAYAVAVRRLDIIFSIILGWRVLGESNIRNKLIGGGLMTAGVAIIAIL